MKLVVHTVVLAFSQKACSSYATRRATTTRIFHTTYFTVSTSRSPPTSVTATVPRPLYDRYARQSNRTHIWRSERRGSRRSHTTNTRTRTLKLEKFNHELTLHTKHLHTHTMSGPRTGGAVPCVSWPRDVEGTSADSSNQCIWLRAVHVRSVCGSYVEQEASAIRWFSGRAGFIEVPSVGSGAAPHQQAERMEGVDVG